MNIKLNNARSNELAEGGSSTNEGYWRLVSYWIQTNVPYSYSCCQNSRAGATRFSLTFLADKFSQVGLTGSNSVLAEGFEYAESVDGWLKLRLIVITCLWLTNVYLKG